jgi:PncC family amidohydrolase
MSEPEAAQDQPITALTPELVELGRRCGKLLTDRGETVGVAEGSCGGLISAALLAVPGASAYYLGGTVIYTKRALDALLTGEVERPRPLQGASEPWALHLARGAKLHLEATWGIGEGGAAGPSGNRYGNPAGHAWVAVSGPSEAAENVLTGASDRLTNMGAFAAAALKLLHQQLEA